MDQQYVILDSNTSCFISKQVLSFGETIELLKQMRLSDDKWQLASIAEIECYEKDLRQFIASGHSTSLVWVSDLLEIDLGTINIPKFYCCDMNLAKPKNGSIALTETKCLALFIKKEE